MEIKVMGTFCKCGELVDSERMSVVPFHGKRFIHGLRSWQKRCGVMHHINCPRCGYIKLGADSSLAKYCAKCAEQG